MLRKTLQAREVYFGWHYTIFTKNIKKRYN